MKTNRILRELRREISNLKRAAEEHTFEEWVKDRKFNNSQTGNQVNFGSLPADQQKEERAKFDKSQKKKEEGDSPSSSSAFEEDFRQKVMKPLDEALERALEMYGEDHDAEHSKNYGEILTERLWYCLSGFFEDHGWDESFSEAEVLSTIGKDPKKMMSIAKVIRESAEKMAEGINKVIKKENADRKVSSEEQRKCKIESRRLRKEMKNAKGEDEYKKASEALEQAQKKMFYYKRLRGQEARKPVTAEDIYTASLTQRDWDYEDHESVKLLFSLSEKTLKDCEERAEKERAEKAKKDKEREEKNRKMREEAEKEKAERAERDKEREEKNRKMREEAQRQRAEKKEKERAERAEKERAKEIEKQVKAEYEKKKKESEEKIKKEQKSITDLFDEMEGGKLTPDEAMGKLSYLEGLHSASPYGSALADTFKETKAKIEKKREEENESIFTKLKKKFFPSKSKKKATLKTARLTAEALRDEVKSLKRDLR